MAKKCIWFVLKLQVIYQEDLMIWGDSLAGHVRAADSACRIYAGWGDQKRQSGSGFCHLGKGTIGLVTFCHFLEAESQHQCHAPRNVCHSSPLPFLYSRQISCRFCHRQCHHGGSRYKKALILSERSIYWQAVQVFIGQVGVDALTTMKSIWSVLFAWKEQKPFCMLDAI